MPYQRSSASMIGYHSPRKWTPALKPNAGIMNVNFSPFKSLQYYVRCRKACEQTHLLLQGSLHQNVTHYKRGLLSQNVTHYKGDRSLKDMISAYYSRICQLHKPFVSQWTIKMTYRQSRWLHIHQKVIVILFPYQLGFNWGWGNLFQDMHTPPSLPNYWSTARSIRNFSPTIVMSGPFV